MGIRYRHEVCEAWIRAGLPVGRVLERLGEANFDPELCPQHEEELVGVFNRLRTDRTIRLRRRRGLRSWFAKRQAG